MTLIAPLDLQTLLVSTFAGSTLIFIVVALIMVMFGATKFKMPLIVVGAMVMLFSIIVLPITQWLYIFAAIIIGLLVGYTLTRLQR